MVVVSSKIVVVVVGGRVEVISSTLERQEDLNSGLQESTRKNHDEIEHETIVCFDVQLTRKRYHADEQDGRRRKPA